MSDYKLDEKDNSERPELDSNQCAICGREKLPDSDLCKTCEKEFDYDDIP